jgi:hypothetical protein
MSKPTVLLTAALLCCAVANAADPPIAGNDIVSNPDPQVDGPGKKGAGQGELEMERELQLAGISIPWGEDGDLPSDRAEDVRDGRCLFRYRFVTRNTDRNPSRPTTNRVLLGAVDGPLLHSSRLPTIPGGGEAVSGGQIALAPGRWLLYVQADAADRIIERNEANNLRRVRVTVHGDCSARAASVHR